MVTPESSNEFPWISIWQLVKPHANYCVDILKHADCVLRLLNRTDCYVWLYQKNFWLFMFEMHLINGITDGWQGCEPLRPLPSKIKKPGSYLTCILVFTILLVSVDCCFLHFSECFPVISGFCIAVQYQICYCFSTIFWVLASGLTSAKFPLARTSSYVIACDHSKVVLQISAMCRVSSSILQ